MADWTPSIVEARLAEAAWVLKRMPEPRLSGYFSTWPEFVYSFADKVEQEPKPMRQDRLAARLWNALERSLLDRRAAAIRGQPALALWAVCHLAAP